MITSCSHKLLQETYVWLQSAPEMKCWCFRALHVCLMYISEMLGSWGVGHGKYHVNPG